MHAIHGILHVFSFQGEKRRGNIPKVQFSCMSTDLFLKWCEAIHFSLNYLKSLASGNNTGFSSELQQILLHCAIIPSFQSVSVSLLGLLLDRVVPKHHQPLKYCITICIKLNILLKDQCTFTVFSRGFYSLKQHCGTFCFCE